MFSIVSAGSEASVIVVPVSVLINIYMEQQRDSMIRQSDHDSPIKITCQCCPMARKLSSNDGTSMFSRRGAALGGDSSSKQMTVAVDREQWTPGGVKPVPFWQLLPQ